MKSNTNLKLHDLKCAVETDTLKFAYIHVLHLYQSERYRQGFLNEPNQELPTRYSITIVRYSVSTRYVGCHICTHRPSVFHMIHIVVGLVVSWAPSATQDAALEAYIITVPTYPVWHEE